MKPLRSFETFLNEKLSSEQKDILDDIIIMWTTEDLKTLVAEVQKEIKRRGKK